MPAGVVSCGAGILVAVEAVIGFVIGAEIGVVIGIVIGIVVEVETGGAGLKMMGAVEVANGLAAGAGAGVARGLARGCDVDLCRIRERAPGAPITASAAHAVGVRAAAWEHRGLSISCALRRPEELPDQRMRATRDGKVGEEAGERLPAHAEQLGCGGLASPVDQAPDSSCFTTRRDRAEGSFLHAARVACGLSKTLRGARPSQHHDGLRGNPSARRPCDGARVRAKRSHPQRLERSGSAGKRFVTVSTAGFCRLGGIGLTQLD